MLILMAAWCISPSIHTVTPYSTFSTPVQLPRQPTNTTHLPLKTCISLFPLVLPWVTDRFTDCFFVSLLHFWVWFTCILFFLSHCGKRPGSKKLVVCKFETSRCMHNPKSKNQFLMMPCWKSCTVALRTTAQFKMKRIYSKLNKM